MRKKNSKSKCVSDQVTADIRVKLIPRSSMERIVGIEGGVLKVKVTSPPVDGMANKALIRLLAKRLRVSKGSIDIISGKNSRLKSIRIPGFSLQQINNIFQNGGQP